jgi:uncharacterized membrane protein
MKTLIKNIVIGAAGLMLAAAPLAASAQSWHDHDRGQGRGNYQRGDYDRGHYDHRDWHGGGYARPVYQEAYPQPYVNGYFGWAPGGFQGYYWNGGWYQHRRWNGGVWLYF